MSMFGKSYLRYPTIHTQRGRHKGFEALTEFVNPELRPNIHINTVEKLIRYKCQELYALVESLCTKWTTCHVYLPWSSDGWAFAIFQPGDDVKTLLTELALEFEQYYHGNDAVKVTKNIFNPSKRFETDYSRLVLRPKTLMVFGDNTSGLGRGGSAVIRNYPNTYGIPTGWSDNYGRWTKEKEAVFKNTK